MADNIPTLGPARAPTGRLRSGREVKADYAEGIRTGEALVAVATQELEKTIALEREQKYAQANADLTVDLATYRQDMSANPNPDAAMIEYAQKAGSRADELIAGIGVLDQELAGLFQNQAVKLVANGAVAAQKDVMDRKGRIATAALADRQLVILDKIALANTSTEVGSLVDAYVAEVDANFQYMNAEERQADLADFQNTVDLQAAERHIVVDPDDYLTGRDSQGELNWKSRELYPNLLPRQRDALFLDAQTKQDRNHLRAIRLRHEAEYREAQAFVPRLYGTEEDIAAAEAENSENGGPGELTISELMASGLPANLKMVWGEKLRQRAQGGPTNEPNWYVQRGLLDRVLDSTHMNDDGVNDHITHPSALIPYYGAGLNTEFGNTLIGHIERIRREKRNNPTRLEQRNDFLKNIAQLITRSNPNQGLVDPLGNKQLFLFKLDFTDRWAALEDAGKDPTILIRPVADGKPNPQYMGGTYIRNYVPTAEERLKASTDLMLAPRGGEGQLSTGQEAAVVEEEVELTTRGAGRTDSKMGRAAGQRAAAKRAAERRDEQAAAGRRAMKGKQARGVGLASEPSKKKDADAEAVAEETAPDHFVTPPGIPPINPGESINDYYDRVKHLEAGK